MLCPSTPVHFLLILLIFLLTAKSSEHHGLVVSSARPPLPNKFTSKYGHLGLTNNVNNNNYKTDAHTLELITNEIFGSVMLDKSDQLLAHNFDELGILDPESSPKVRSQEVKQTTGTSVCDTYISVLWCRARMFKQTSLITASMLLYWKKNPQMNTLAVNRSFL